MRRSTKIHAVIAALYVVFFALYFLSLPLKDSIPGNCDSWLAIAYSNTYLNQLQAFITGDGVGRAMYPVENIAGFGESSLGLGAVFILFRLIGANDVVALYGLLVTVFSSTAWAVYLLVREYAQSTSAAVFAGFAFGAANFTLANIDSPHTVFFAVMFWSWLFLLKAFRHQQSRHLYVAAALAGAQAYLGAYVFLLEFIALAIVAAVHWRQWITPALRRHAPAGALVYVLIALPFFNTYYQSLTGGNVVNPWNAKAIAEAHSLDPIDLMRKLPNNLYNRRGNPVTVADAHRSHTAYQVAGFEDFGDVLGPDHAAKRTERSDPNNILHFNNVRRCAFIGIFLYLLAAIGLWRWQNRPGELIAVGVVGFVLALGPLAIVFGQAVPMPMYPVYAGFDVAGLFRIPSRSFFLTLLPLVVFAARGLTGVIDRFGRPSVFVAMATVLVLVENLPLPLHAFAAPTEPPAVYRHLFASSTTRTILELPSDLGLEFARDAEDLFAYNREVIYMNWQTYHRQNILNGVNGYFPVTRMETQRLIDALPQSLPDLSSSYDLRTVVFHKDFVLADKERALLKELRASPLLEQRLETPDLVIFELSRLARLPFQHALRRAQEYLQQTQQADGSWLSYKGPEPDIELLDDSRGYATSFALANLHGTSTASSDFVSKAEYFVLAQKNAPDLTWNYDGKDHDYCCGKHHNIGSWLPPDADTTALALVALKGRLVLSAAEVIQLDSHFRHYQNASGLFPSFFVGYYGTHEAPIDLAHDTEISVGVNANILTMLTAWGLRTERLVPGLKKLVEDGRGHNDPYYSPLVVAHLLCQAAQRSAPNAERLAEIQMSQIEGKIEPTLLNTVDLAAFVHAKSFLLARKGLQATPALEAAAAELGGRQLPDGNWPKAPMAFGGNADIDDVEMNDRFTRHGSYVFRNQLQFANMPLEMLESFVASFASRGHWEDVGAAMSAICTKNQSEPIDSLDPFSRICSSPDKDTAADVLMADVVTNGQLGARLYLYYTVLFEATSRQYYSSPAVTTAFAVKALTAFNAVFEPPQ